MVGRREIFVPGFDAKLQKCARLAFEANKIGADSNHKFRKPSWSAEKYVSGKYDVSYMI